MIPRRQIAAEFAILLPAGCGVVAADVIGAEPARKGSPVTACDFAFDNVLGRILIGLLNVIICCLYGLKNVILFCYTFSCEVQYGT